MLEDLYLRVQLLALDSYAVILQTHDPTIIEKVLDERNVDGSCYDRQVVDLRYRCFLHFKRFLMQQNYVIVKDRLCKIKFLMVLKRLFI